MTKYLLLFHREGLRLARVSAIQKPQKPKQGIDTEYDTTYDGDRS